jgi:NodT family efflux transporter outer membrane factor (OMF) lipoprotein
MTNLLKIVTGLAVAALLISCAGPEERDAIPLDVELPGTWTAGETPGGSVPVDWWTLFRDPALDALVREALRNNHDVKEAAARIQSARAVARMAGADLLPTVGLGTSAARARTPGPLGEPVSQNRLNASLTVGWEVDLWGRIRAGQTAAVKEAELTRALYESAKLSIAAHTARAVFAVVEARLQVELAKTTVESYRNTLKAVRDRFHRGVVSPLDVRFATANLAAARAGHQQRREVLERTVRRLEILLGRYPSGAVTGGLELPAVPPPVPAGLPSGLLRRRPDLVAARFRVHAADARVFEARASLLPRLSLTAGGGAASSELADLFKGDALVWNLVGNMVQPLFQGGKLRANVDLQEARTREALEAYASACLDAFREVETALASELILKGREEDIREAAHHASQARRQAEERYLAGLAGIVQVLEAQRRELESKSRWIAVRREMLDNRVALHLALGGGFTQ